MSRILAVAAILGAVAPAAAAHDLLPAYLEIRGAATDTYDVLWRVPAAGGGRLAIHVRLPEGAEEAQGRHLAPLGGAFVERWRFRRPGGLAGGTLRFDGLAANGVDVVVRVAPLDGPPWTALVRPSRPWLEISRPPGTWEVARSYFALGVEHIWTGVDHLLFVAALLLLVRGWQRAVATVTAFTVAHSVTLGAATLDLVQVPSAPVEATIALSIVFVAAEIVRARQGRPGLAERAPYIVALTFGLLHGFGFAGALKEAGLPEDSVPAALLFFNLGVEAGQILFIAAAVAVAALGRRLARPRAAARPAWAWRVPPYAIGSMAAYWVLERVLLL